MSDGRRADPGAVSGTISPDDERPSFVMRWRSRVNPWAVAFIAGIVTITIVRFRTRYVPDAPAPIGAIAIPGMERVPGIRIAGVVSSADDAAPLGTLADKLRVTEKPITVVALTRRTDLPLPPGVVGVPLPDSAAATLDADLRALLRTTLPAGDPARHGLLLVDGDGQCRGLYGTSEDGIDEIFHRSQHIHRDDLAKAKGAP